MTDEPKCRCWKPAEPQADCPVHGTLAQQRRVIDQQEGFDDLYASEQDGDIYRDLGGEA